MQLEGLSYVLRSLGNLQLTPDLDTPRYTVLKRTAEYEIRKYDPYIVAEVPMPSASGPAAGDGFNELARYIFGGNDRCDSHENNLWTERSVAFRSISGCSDLWGRQGIDNLHIIPCRQQKMEMTSPVFSTAGQRTAKDRPATVATMQFPMERKYGSLDSLPHPDDVR